MTKRRYKSNGGRDQLSLLPAAIDDYVHRDNPVRAIDIYVNTLNLHELGFQHAAPAAGAGQPPYDPAQMLKLALYGYQNQLRSSRRLERETHRNLEVMWLMDGLVPSYKTIADFRKDNAEAFKKTNRDFVLLCRELNLLGGETVAIDGSFFHANASKASIHTAKRLEKQLAEIEEKIARYMSEMDDNDRFDDKAGTGALQTDNELAEKLDALKAKQREKQALRQALVKSGESQLSTTDRDARLLNKGDGAIAGYNVQSVVDAEHKLIVAGEVTNDGNDQHQLYRQAEAAKDVLRVDQLEALADAGYFDGEELKACEDAGITVYVPEPDKSSAVRAGGRFTRNAFRWDETGNAYRCPGEHWLEQRGRPFKKNGKILIRYASRAAACRDCALKKKCLGKKMTYRQINRYEHEEVVERHRARMKEARGRMRQRASLVEHPFGTLKCRFGWLHFLVRGFEKVGGEWALMITGYNFTRVLNIIGMEAFMAFCAKRKENRAMTA